MTPKWMVYVRKNPKQTWIMARGTPLKWNPHIVDPWSSVSQPPSGIWSNWFSWCLGLRKTQWLYGYSMDWFKGKS